MQQAAGEIESCIGHIGIEAFTDSRVSAVPSRSIAAMVLPLAVTTSGLGKLNKGRYKAKLARHRRSLGEVEVMVEVDVLAFPALSVMIGWQKFQSVVQRLWPTT